MRKIRRKGRKEVICLNVKNCLVAAVLSAIVLALVFIPLSGSQTAMPYDPWADINDDGYIDGKDVSYTARLFGTTGDPTKNVNVTNWPQDRPPTAKRGAQKVIIQDTVYPPTQLAAPGYGDVEYYYWMFKPEGKLINVTNIYVNIIWRADVTGTGSQPHSVYLMFINMSKPSDWTYFKLGPLGPDTTIKNECFSAIEENPSFEFSLITEGVNYIAIDRTDSYGNYIYIYKLELIIEYYYSYTF
jgi:hypothetical protein